MRGAGRWVVVVASTALASCGLLGADTLESMRARSGAGEGARVYDSLDDLLGNTRYRFGDAPPTSLTVAVVAGRFESARPGRAFVVPGGDAPGGQVAEFDTDDAVWKTVEADFVVDQVVSGDARAGETLSVGISADPDVDPGRVEDDLRDLGRAVVFLDRSEVFAYDASLYGISSNGSMLATVGDDGTLGLPALGGDEARQLLAGTPTLDALVLAAARPGRLLVVDPSSFQVLEELPDPP